MADYPNSFYSPRPKENKPGITYDPERKIIIFKEDFDSLEAEIKAIEEVLGLNLRDTNGNLDLKNKKIINVANPTSAQDAATKDYIDNQNLWTYKNNAIGSKVFFFSASSSAITANILKFNASISAGIYVVARILQGDWANPNGGEEECLAHIRRSSGTWGSGSVVQKTIINVGTLTPSAFSWITDGDGRKLQLTMNRSYSGFFVKVDYVIRVSIGEASMSWY